MGRREYSFSSELTIKILLILRHSLAPTKYISLLTGEPTKKISKYLSTLKRKGLVSYIEGFWTLTPNGERIAKNLENIFKPFYQDHLIKFLNNYLKSEVDKDRKTTKIQIYSNLFKDIHRNSNLFTKIHNSIHFNNIVERAMEFLGRELTDTERAVLEFLYSFSISRRRRYWWPSDSLGFFESLAEEVSRFVSSSISSIDVQEAVRALEAAGVLYITRDRRVGWKIRISKALFP